MNAAQKIQHFTGIKPVEVREWAYVYWVKLPGRRPTLYSKKIVDRASEIQVRYLISDRAARDTRTGKVYMIRSDFQMGYFLKEVAPGQSITDWSDFSQVKGDVVAQVRHNPRPRRISEIIAYVASHAS